MDNFDGVCLKRNVLWVVCIWEEKVEVFLFNFNLLGENFNDWSIDIYIFVFCILNILIIGRY